MMGLFGGMFDFNHNGKMDGIERAAEFSFWASVLENHEEGDFDKEDFATVGLDMDELDLMDEDERIEALEEAGLDPDGYYF